MKILNEKIEFDFFDAEQAEKLEKCIAIAEKELKELKIEGKKQSEFIRDFCNIIETFFENVFGKACLEKIFKNKKNIDLCISAFSDLITAREEQEKKLIEKEKKIIGKMAEISIKK